MSEAETDRIAESVAHLADMVERMEAARPGGSSANGNTLNLVGAGKYWHGLAIGVSLGAVVVAVGWINSTMQRYEMRLQQYDISIQQGQAYKSAVYVVSQRLAEEIDKELDRQKDKTNEQPDPDHHPTEEAEARERQAGR